MMRSRQVILKAISAAVGLGLVGLGAWLSVMGDAHASTLILAGVAVIGGLSTVALPRLGEAATPPDGPRARKRRRGGMAPPIAPVVRDDTPTTQTRLFGASLALLMLSGCGASALAMQADAAAITGRSLAEADVTLMRVRAAELDVIVEDARSECPDGCPDRAAHHLAAHDAAVTRWRPVLGCRAPVVEGLRAWIDAIELAHTAATDELGLAHVVAEAARAVMLYAGLRECVEAGAPDVDLPELPAVVLSYAQGAAQ